MSDIIPVIFPFAWIVCDVSADVVEGAFVADDVVVKSRLPGEIAVSHCADAFGGYRFELADHGSNGMGM